MDTTNLALLKKYLPFWEKLHEDEKNLITNKLSIIIYQCGENIHSGYHHCTGMLIVKTGHLRVYMLSAEGKEITLYRLHPGDTCILSASCVLQTIHFDVFVDAEEKSEILLIPSLEIAQLVKQNIYVECFTYQLATERFSDVMWTMQQILFLSFDKRLATFLLKEAEKNNSNVIKLSHDQIAKYMASAREVVSRMLKYFAEEGIVALGRREIDILDTEKLKDLL